MTNFDRFLVREPRLLVPVDVQALVVRAGANDTDPMLRLPFRNRPPSRRWTSRRGRAPPTGRAPAVVGPRRDGHGQIVADPAAPGDPTRHRLELPALPDRWLVLRLAVPAGATDPLVTGWVIEADTGTVTPLTQWPVEVQPPRRGGRSPPDN